MNINNNYPKIGIRPIIDGRLGSVRESLEETTMRMAQSVKKLYENTLRYPNGSFVECVIADTCIGGIAEANACIRKFETAHVGLTLSVTPCWCYGSETMEMTPRWPTAIWGFNGTKRPGAVYLAATLAAHNQFGLPAFGIYGRDVQEMGEETIPPDVREKLLDFARSGLAVAIMRNKAYLAIGSVSMGIAGSMVNPDLFREYFGMRNEYVDSTEILRRIESTIYDQKEFNHALSWTKANCKEGKDPNTPAKQFDRNHKDRDWRFVVKMALIIRDLMQGNPKLKKMGHGEEAQGHDAIVSGFQGQRQWTDFLPNGDFAEAILNSSFDWNGIRPPILVATENEALNGLSMLLGNLITHQAQVFADVRTYWSPDAVERVSGYRPEAGFIHLINSGSAALDGAGPEMKPFWEITEKDTNDYLKATTWYPANNGYFRGGGYSSQFVTKGGMPVTLCRLNYIKGLGPVLQIAEGHTIDLPPVVHKLFDNRTDPTWPTTWFVPRLTGSGPFTDAYTVMNAWGANHGSFSYGHYGHQLITLAAMLRIPVNMHNVGDERIFRPSAWGFFANDHEACKTYGPLYR